jgi:hypothetical protein
VKNGKLKSGLQLLRKTKEEENIGGLRDMDV